MSVCGGGGGGGGGGKGGAPTNVMYHLCYDSKYKLN